MSEVGVPGPDERSVLIGDTGSGKSVFAQQLAALYREVQYLDYKGEFVPQVPDYRRTDNLLVAWRLRGHVLVRPRMSQFSRDWAQWYLSQMLRRRRDVLILVDEVYLLGGMNHSSYPPALAQIAVTGRSKRLPLMVGIQRPKFAPTVLWAQTNHWYIWALGDEDLPVLAGWIPRGALDEVQRLRYDHGFVHVWKEKGARKVWTVHGPLAL